MAEICAALQRCVVAPQAEKPPARSAAELERLGYDPIVAQAAAAVAEAAKVDKLFEGETWEYYGISRKYRTTEAPWKVLDGVDLEAALTASDELGGAPVRLLDARFIVELNKRGGSLCRRQAIPEEAYVPLAKLKLMHAGGQFGTCLAVIGTSHPWQQPDNPDPKRFNLKTLAAALECFLNHRPDENSNPPPCTYAVFFDFCSLYQWEHTPQQDELFKRALQTMLTWYCHTKLLTFKLTKLPEGYPTGWTFPEGTQ